MNLRGEDLWGYLSGSDLHVINSGNKPTFVVAKRSEVLDISLASSSAIKDLEAWWVDDEESSSDHRYVRFNLNFGPPVIPEYRDKKKTQWDLYKSLIMRDLDKTPLSIPATTAEIDERTEAITGILVGSFHEACPLKPVKANRKIVPW